MISRNVRAYILRRLCTVTLEESEIIPRSGAVEPQHASYTCEKQSLWSSLITFLSPSLHFPLTTILWSSLCQKEKYIQLRDMLPNWICKKIFGYLNALIFFGFPQYHKLTKWTRFVKQTNRERKFSMAATHPFTGPENLVPLSKEHTDLEVVGFPRVLLASTMCLV